LALDVKVDRGHTVKSIVVVIPHSHTWFWTQTCLASLKRNPPIAFRCKITVIVVDNSPWSPAIRGITDTSLGDDVIVIPNHKSNKFHASALDCVVEDYDFDYLMAMETDVMALRPTWLRWFVNQMRHSDFAVGMWHHEQFVNPSCTLYRGNVLREMLEWCGKYAPQDELRWGELFTNTAPLDNNLPLSENPAEILQGLKNWISGPFAEKRGWPAKTYLKEAPSGQLKGPGWYEPGQQLHHWAVNEGYTYRVCDHLTTYKSDNPGLPLQSLYGSELMPDPKRQLEAVELFGNAETAHLWGGTRALDILKHPVTCEFVKANTPGWLAREARFWRQTVPIDVREQTLDLIRKYGWHITGQGSDHISDRDREAAAFVKECYEAGGVTY
jgi:hypothetical protein